MRGAALAYLDHLADRRQGDPQPRGTQEKPTTTPEEVDKVRRLTATFALDVDDCRELLDALGLLP